VPAGRHGGEWGVHPLRGIRMTRRCAWREAKVYRRPCVVNALRAEAFRPQEAGPCRDPAGREDLTSAPPGRTLYGIA
jgi:hypothetical protein